MPNFKLPQILDVIFQLLFGDSDHPETRVVEIVFDKELFVFHHFLIIRGIFREKLTVLEYHI